MAYNDRNPLEDGEDRPLLLSQNSGMSSMQVSSVLSIVHETDGILIVDPDVEFGGKKAREVLERNLLRKVDRRMSILVLIYILNCMFPSNFTVSYQILTLSVRH